MLMHVFIIYHASLELPLSKHTFQTGGWDESPPLQDTDDHSITLETFFCHRQIPSMKDCSDVNPCFHTSPAVLSG